MGLMGDPTLRLHVISPAKDLTASFSGSDVELSWSPSSDPVLGYYIYRSDEYNGHYTLLNNTPVDSTTYTDKCIEESGKYFYMVRATLLQNSPSGSYYNLSQVVFTYIQR
jgi:fibronectin type 3 domain-containing protein